MLNYLFVLLVALVLAGCATPNTIRLTDGKGSDAKVVATYDIDPVRLSGLPWTKDLREANFVTVMGDFPRTAENYAEWDPSRIRYQAYAIDATGKEYPASAVFAGFITCRPRLFIIIEGLRTPDKTLKAVTLSTMLNRAYTLDGQEIPGFNARAFQTDTKYRRELVNREGTPVATQRPVFGMWRAISDNWEIYKTQSGQIVSPLKLEQVKFLAGLNPQYSYWEKVVGTAHFGVSPDYVSTAVGIAIDLIRAAGAKSQGFDAESLQTRMRQGYNLKVFEVIREEGGCKA